AASWRKSPPAPPYSSGIEAHKNPISPASSQASRSSMPFSRHFSSCASQSLKTLSALSCSISISSSIHFGLKQAIVIDPSLVLIGHHYYSLIGISLIVLSLLIKPAAILSINRLFGLINIITELP